MERCPCCTARLGDATLCPRCQADLGNAIGAEQAARHWLAKAVRHCHNDEIEQGLSALERSLGLKKTKAAVVFREFLIAQQCRIILELLAARQFLPATTRFYQLSLLLPYSPQLQKLRSFTDYLSLQHQQRSA